MAKCKGWVARRTWPICGTERCLGWNTRGEEKYFLDQTLMWAWLMRAHERHLLESHWAAIWTEEELRSWDLTDSTWGPCEPSGSSICVHSQAVLLLDLCSLNPGCLQFSALAICTHCLFIHRSYPQKTESASQLFSVTNRRYLQSPPSCSLSQMLSATLSSF